MQPSLHLFSHVCVCFQDFDISRSSSHPSSLYVDVIYEKDSLFRADLRSNESRIDRSIDGSVTERHFLPSSSSSSSSSRQSITFPQITPTLIAAEARTSTGGGGGGGGGNSFSRWHYKYTTTRKFAARGISAYVYDFSCFLPPSLPPE